ncbi:MAG: peptidase M23 [Magnetovibrio sp.]|nr:peptidase M23 [Magnetovibrio sp.]
MQAVIPSKFGILFISLILVGCGYAEWPPPSGGLRDLNRTELAKTSRSATSKAPKKEKQIIIKKGDTVWGLSSRYAVSMRSIIEWNNLKAPFHLKVGQRIIVKDNPEHLVVRGDTLYELAMKYETNTHALARLNSLKPPYIILSGQRLRLPVRGIRVTLVKENSSQIKQGVKQFKPSVGIKNTRRIKSTKVSPADSISIKRSSVLKKSMAHEQDFIWPVKGRIISDFGAKPKGFHNDGINIAAPRGTEIKAAQNGIIVYSGNELRGFGNLLLIKHIGGWVTAYAHVERLIVKRGDKVKKGQRIATVGKTGGVMQPQLHFEIRKGRRAHNPQKYLQKI